MPPNDDVQYIKLPNGEYGKFRADASDDVIRSAILKDFPEAFGKPSTQWAGLENAKPRGLSNSRFGQPMAEFQPATDAKRQAEEEHQRNLSSIATTGKEIPGSATKSSVLRNVSGLSGLAEGVFSPQGAAIAAANTNPFTAVPVDAALVGHGLYKFGSNAPKAVQGYPDAAESSLGGLAEAASGAAGLKAFSPRINAARTALAQKTVEPLVYENLGETGADVRMGINPERAITREGLTGTKPALLEKAVARTGELKEAANNILRTGPNASKSIDVEPIIDEAIDKAVANQKKVAGDTTRLENLRTALKTQYGPTNGNPFEVNNLKTSIQEAANNVGAYKNTQPIEGSLADAMREVARGIKDKVNETSPDAAPLNERMTDLIDAQGGLQKGINATKGRSLFGGFHEGMASTLLNRTIGSAPVRSLTARGLMTGLTEDVPRVASPFQPPRGAGPLVQGNPTPFTGGGPTPMMTPYQAPVGTLPTVGFPAQSNLWSPSLRSSPQPQWETPTTISTSPGLYGEEAAAEARARAMGSQGAYAPRHAFGGPFEPRANMPKRKP